jgi:hypothetical protein
MVIIDKGIACSALIGVLLLAAGAPATMPAERCESSKLKMAGTYGFCRLAAESKSVKTGMSTCNNNPASCAADWRPVVWALPHRRTC